MLFFLPSLLATGFSQYLDQSKWGNKNLSLTYLKKILEKEGQRQIVVKCENENKAFQ